MDTKIWSDQPFFWVSYLLQVVPHSRVRWKHQMKFSGYPVYLTNLIYQIYLINLSYPILSYPIYRSIHLCIYVSTSAFTLQHPSAPFYFQLRQEAVARCTWRGSRYKNQPRWRSWPWDPVNRRPFERWTYKKLLKMDIRWHRNGWST